jgi:hypothetical protein
MAKGVTLTTFPHSSNAPLNPERRAHPLHPSHHEEDKVAGTAPLKSGIRYSCGNKLWRP